MVLNLIRKRKNRAKNLFIAKLPKVNLLTKKRMAKNLLMEEKSTQKTLNFERRRNENFEFK